MRLKAFGVRETGPVDNLAVENLADVVVVAGPNGVGKTSVLNAVLQLAQNPHAQATSGAKVWMVVEATNAQEKATWGRGAVDTRVAGEGELLRQTLQTNRRRNKYNSSFLNFDSDRAIQNIQPFQFSWDVGNPFLEDIGWSLGFGRMSDRYNDVMHSLFRLVEAQHRELAEKAIALKSEGVDSMALDFPDVLSPFKDAFYSLVGPKRLTDVSLKEQGIFYEQDGERRNIFTLSSGEREVINVVFDFILRNPSDCVIMFDEPELHLHPELSYRLLQTLSRVGINNQFIFSTHSPEIISASLENTVVFMRPKQLDGENQAIIVHSEDETHHALKTLGQSIGVISLGKKLVLIEGDESSLDKQTYGAILRNRFPELILVPVGGKDALRSFDDIRESILGRTIWGVEFFMLCDRDAVNALGPSALNALHERQIKQLPRYHIENYFLDPAVLALIFEQMEPPDSWLRDIARIDARLREIAKEGIAYAVALTVNATFRERIGNVSLMPKGVGNASNVDALISLLRDRAVAEATRVSGGLDLAAVEALVRSEYQRLGDAIVADDPAWRRDIPGRPVLNKFAGDAKIQVGRLKQMYLTLAEHERDFGEIIDIFARFRG